MASVTSATKSTTLSAIKQANADTQADSDTGESPTVIASGTKQVGTNTTVTTVVLASSDSKLPSISLEDVLERSGVQDSSEIILAVETDSLDEGAPGGSSSVTGMGQTAEQLQSVVDNIEASGAVVVEVETTNNVQTVTVRAADIEAAYALASTLPSAKSDSGLSNFLLLKNGWAYTTLTASPLELTVGPVNEQPGNGWAPWRSMEDGIHEVQDTATGLWNRLTGKLVDTSQKTPAEVSGAFQTSSVRDHVVSTVTTWDSLQLSSDGLFTTTRTTLASSGMLMQDVSHISQTVKSMNGRTTSFSGLASSGGGSVSTSLTHESLGAAAGDMFGSYRILEDGMTIELSFADGTVEQRLFLRTSSNEVIIDDKAWARTGDVTGNLLEELTERLTRSGIKGGRKGALDIIGDVVQMANRLQAQKGSSHGAGSQPGSPASGSTS